MANADGQATGVIEVRIASVAQLFNSLDPSPFRERDLDRSAEEHIVGWARELPSNLPIGIVVHLQGGEVMPDRDFEVGTAISNYFRERAEQRGRDMRELFRSGWKYLSIGLPVLLGCLAVSQLVRTGLGSGAFARTIEESLIILGWVANWKPLQTFLYDWWPIKRERDLFTRLANAEIVLQQV